MAKHHDDQWLDKMFCTFATSGAVPGLPIAIMIKLTVLNYELLQAIVVMLCSCLVQKRLVSASECILGFIEDRRSCVQLDRQRIQPNQGAEPVYRRPQWARLLTSVLEDVPEANLPLKLPTPTAATNSQLILQTPSTSNHERRQVLHGLGEGDPRQCSAEGLGRRGAGLRDRGRKRKPSFSKASYLLIASSSAFVHSYGPELGLAVFGVAEESHRWSAVLP